MSELYEKMRSNNITFIDEQIVEKKGGSVNHIVIVGRTNSGKTTAGKLIEELSSYHHIEASNILQVVLEQNGLSFSQGNILEFLKKDNSLAVAEEISSIVKEEYEKTVTTGFRKPEEIAYFSNSVPDMIIGCVSAPRQTRMERSIDLTKKNNISEEIGFIKKEAIEEDLGIDETLEKFPSFEIDNSRSLAEFRAAIKYLVQFLSDDGKSTS